MTPSNPSGLKRAVVNDEAHGRCEYLAKAVA
jgi:hypothetical protein